MYFILALAYQVFSGNCHLQVGSETLDCGCQNNFIVHSSHSPLTAKAGPHNSTQLGSETLLRNDRRYNPSLGYRSSRASQQNVYSGSHSPHETLFHAE